MSIRGDDTRIVRADGLDPHLKDSALVGLQPRKMPAVR